VALAIFADTFGKARIKRGTIRRDDGTAEHVVAVTNAVQRVVDTLRDPNTGDRYIVTLAKGVGAATIPGTKNIAVTYQPIFDKNLTVATACTVMTGLVLHEVGHTLYTFQHLDAFMKRYGNTENAGGWGWIEGTNGEQSRYGQRAHDFDKLAHWLFNVADDARLEARMEARVPVAKGCFPSMLHGVGIRTGMDGKPLRWTGERSGKMADRASVALYAMRYPWLARWYPDALTRAERKWWQDWRDRFVQVNDNDSDAIFDLIDEGLARLRQPERQPIADDESGEGNEQEEAQPEGFDDAEDDESEDDDEDDEDWDDDDDDDDDVRDPWDEDTDGGDIPNAGDPFGDEDEDDDEDESEPGEGKGKSEGTEQGDEDDEDDDSVMTGESSDTPPEDWDSDDTGEGDTASGSDGSEAEGEDESESESGGTTSSAGDGEDDNTGPAPTSAYPRTKSGYTDDGFDKSQLPPTLDTTNRGGRVDEADTLQKALDNERLIDRIGSDKWGRARIRPVMPTERMKGGYRRY